MTTSDFDDDPTTPAPPVNPTVPTEAGPTIGAPTPGTPTSDAPTTAASTNAGFTTAGFTNAGFTNAGFTAGIGTATKARTGDELVRRLRRSRSDRIGAGVSGGLGRYFGVDPVLFRVLFAVAAFFGGSGLLAYVLLWALMPEEGTEQAKVDEWLRALRGRNIPTWAAAVVGAVVLWGLTLSWWAPGTLIPFAVVAVVAGLVATRSARHPEAVAPDGTQPDGAWPERTGPVGSDPMAGIRALRAARAARRRPVWAAIFAVLLVAMLTLGLVDWLHGISISAYFWVASAVLAGGFLVSLLARRTVWLVLLLLVPALVGGIMTHGTAAGLGDGAGQQTWTPAGVPATQYRLLIGDARLDLSNVTITEPRHLDVDMGAGQLTIVVPRSIRVHIDSHLNAGNVFFDEIDGGRSNGGVGFEETITPASDSTGPVLNIDVHVAMGAVRITRG